MMAGPMFMHYNAVLRKFPASVLETMKDNCYITTVHCINSAIQKLARASPLSPRIVYRGSNKMQLPLQLAAKDSLGRMGIVEMGFLSLTTARELALQYASGGSLSTVLKVIRGDRSSGACISAFSFYILEEEILFPPLSYLERAGHPTIDVADNGGVVTEVPVSITVNQHSATIDGLVERRKFLHKGMLDNLRGDVDRELQPLEVLVKTIDSPEDQQRSALLKGTGAGLKSFIESAQAMCKQVCDRHKTTPALVFNSDESFCALVREGVAMKAKALISSTAKSELLIAWAALAARLNLSGMRNCVEVVGAQLFSDAALVVGGENVQSARGDGATALAISILSGSWSVVQAVLKHSSSFKHHADVPFEKYQYYPMDQASDLLQLAATYLQPGNLAARMQSGSLPIGLKSEVGALLALLQSAKDGSDSSRQEIITLERKLSRVRAFLDYHAELLKDPPVPLAHAVAQLVAQEEEEEEAVESRCPTLGAGEDAFRIIKCLSKPQTTHQCLLTLCGKQQVRGMAYTPDGVWLARGEGNEVVVCCSASGIEIWRMKGHRHWVMSVDFSPNGDYIASGSRDNDVRIWSIKLGNCYSVLKGHSKDDKTCLCQFYGEGSLKMSNPTCPRQGHSSHVRSVRFSPDGKVLASGGSDMKVILWAWETGERLKALEGHKDEILSIAFNTDGSLLASGDEDGAIKVWMAAKACSKDVEGSIEFCWADFSSQGHASFEFCGADVRRPETAVGLEVVLCKPELADSDITNADELAGKVAVVRRGRVSFQEKTERVTKAGARGLVIVNNDDTLLEAVAGEGYQAEVAVMTIRAKDEGDLLAAGSSACLYNSCLMTFRGHGKAVNSVAFSPNGEYLASASHDQEVRIWSVKEGTCERVLKGHNAPVNGVAFAPDGVHIASCSGASGHSDDGVRMWEVQSGSEVKTLQHPSGVTAVTFDHKKQNIIACVSYDKSIKLWDIQSGSRSEAALQSELVGHNCKSSFSASEDATSRLIELQGPSARPGIKSGETKERAGEGDCWALFEPPCSIEQTVEKEVHENVICDGCGVKPIVGARWNCGWCDNFDFCQSCHQKFLATGKLHDQQHHFDRRRGVVVECTEENDGKHHVGNYVISKKGCLLLAHLRHEDTAPAVGPIAFFSAPSHIKAFSCAGDKIAVGCESGVVLHLQARWLEVA
jgi:WD40 repeat protein